MNAPMVSWVAFARANSSPFISISDDTTPTERGAPLTHASRLAFLPNS